MLLFLLQCKSTVLYVQSWSFPLSLNSVEMCMVQKHFVSLIIISTVSVEYL